MREGRGCRRVGSERAYIHITEQPARHSMDGLIYSASSPNDMTTEKGKGIEKKGRDRTGQDRVRKSWACESHEGKDRNISKKSNVHDEM